MRGFYKKPIFALLMLSLLSFVDATTLCNLKFFEINTEKPGRFIFWMDAGYPDDKNLWEHIYTTETS